MAVSRLALALDYAILLFIPSFVAGTVIVLNGPDGPPIRVAIAGSIPAAAALLFCLLGMFAPGLLQRDAKSPWLAVLLPPIHLSFIVVLVILAILPPNPLSEIPEQIRPTLIWLTPGALALAGLAEAAAILLKLALRGRR